MVCAFVVVVEGSVQFVPWVVVVSRLSEEWLEGGQSRYFRYVHNVKLQGCKVTYGRSPSYLGTYLPPLFHLTIKVLAGLTYLELPMICQRSPTAK